MLALRFAIELNQPTAVLSLAYIGHSPALWLAFTFFGSKNGFKS